MSNFDTAVGATEAALDSEGSAIEENNKRMDSLEGHVTQLNAAWQKLATDSINSDFVKILMDIGTTMLELADTDIGRLITAIVACRIAMAAFNKVMAIESVANFSKALKTTLLTTLESVKIAFYEGAISGGVLGGTFNTLKVATISLTEALLASPLFALAAGGLAIYGTIKAVNELVPKMSELEDKVEDSTEAYEDASQAAEDYRQELENINEQISELQKQDSLSFTDKEELQNLKDQKQELSEMLAIEEKIKNLEQKEQQKDIVDEWNYISDNPFDYFNVDEEEQAIEDAKKKLKEFGNEQAETLGNDRENVRMETADMITAYKALGDEIEKQKDKMSDPEFQGNMDEEKEKLQGLEDTQNNLGKQLAKNVKKIKEWYDALEGNDEYDDIRNQMGDYIEHGEEVLGINEEVEESTEDSSEQTNQYSENLANATTKVSDLNTEIDKLQESYNTLSSAVDEYNSNGSLSLDTLQSLLSLDDEYLSMLTLENGQLSLNTSALDAKAEALKSAKIEQLQAAATSDLYNLSQGDTDKLSNLAKAAIAAVGDTATTTGNDLSTAAGQAAQFNAQMAATAATFGLSTDVGSDAQKIIDAYSNAAKSVGNLTITTKKTTSSKSGSGSSKSSSSSSEAYKATIDTLYNYTNALSIAEDAVDKLSDALGDTDNYNEQERYLNRLIDATNNQINKTNDLKNAQTSQINDYINQLRAQGFAIDYNNQTNELYINNMEHLADFTGDTAKSLEKMIDKVQDLNDDNVDLDSSIRDLTSDVKDYYEQLADIPEEKLEKFNELMEEFQQSRLQQIEDQITDLEHEMENDPRLQALEAQIEALENQNDELEDQKNLEEKILAVEKAKEQLANAQSQKSVLVYRQNQGWVYEADQDAIAEAQEELQDAQEELNEQVRQDEIDSLKEQKEEIENSYQDRIDALQDFLDEQNYLIDKSNREGVESFSELSEALKKYGLDSAEYLGKASTWLNNYNSELAKLNTTVNGILSSASVATDGLIYSSATQARIDTALSSVLSTGVGLSNVSYSSTSGSGAQSIYIENISLPNVQNADDFVEALKQLPALASSVATKRI